MILDGVNVESFGVIVLTRAESRKAAATRQQIFAANGADWRLRLGREAPEPLPVTLTGHVVGDTLEELQDRIDEFKFRTNPDVEHSVKWSDDQPTVDRPAGSFRVWRDDLAISGLFPDWVQPAVAFRLNLIAPIPYRIEDIVQQSGIGAGAGPIVHPLTIGTAPHPVTIKIDGGTSGNSDLVINYRNKSGVVQDSLSLPATLAAGERLTIDTETFSADIDGTPTPVNGTFFRVRPEDGDFYGNPGAPDIEITSVDPIGISSVSWERRYQ